MTWRRYWGDSVGIFYCNGEELKVDGGWNAGRRDDDLR